MCAFAKKHIKLEINASVICLIAGTVLSRLGILSSFGCFCYRLKAAPLTFKEKDYASGLFFPFYLLILL